MYKGFAGFDLLMVRFEALNKAQKHASFIDLFLLLSIFFYGLDLHCLSLFIQHLVGPCWALICVSMV
jgi:hypothetical protein